MRRLTAYRERYTQVAGSANFGRLTIVEKIGVTTTSNSLALAFRFEYNYTKYAVVLSKKGGDALSASNLTALGIGTDEVIINVEMKRYKVWISTTWALTQAIAPYVAAVTGMQIYSRTATSTTITTILQADTSASQKQVTSIANVNSTYLNSVTASLSAQTVYSTSTTKFDFFDLDLDDKTSIGITYQGFNPEAPDQIGFKFSNAFSIPRTANNDKLTGYGGNSDDVYDPWFVNYIVDNEKVVSSGKIKVTDISIDRINCSISAKSTIWDRLKEWSMSDFIANRFTLISKPSQANWSGFIDALASNEFVSTKAFYGDLFGDSEISMVSRDSEYKSDALNEIVYKITGYDGNQVVIYVKEIFRLINTFFGLDFLTNSTVFDSINPYVQLRYFRIKQTTGAFPLYELVYMRGFSNGSTDNIKIDKSKKTVYDFVKEFIIHSGCLVDIIDDTTIALNRMDDLFNSNIIDFSGNIEKDSIVFSPLVDGVAQNNIIDFSEYSKKIQKGSLQLNIPCFNQNVETTAQFLELKEFAPPAYLDRDKSVLGLFEDETWNNFTFLQDSGNTAEYICLAYFNLSTELSATKTLAIAKIMDVGYSLWAEMIKKPRKYSIKKWLTSADIKNIKLFQRYWIEELQGYFMLLKINGLNPEKSNAPTEIEFIQIPDHEETLTVSPTIIARNPTGGNINIDISSNANWEITESLSWLSLSKNIGRLNDTVVATIQNNTTEANRNGTITARVDNGITRSIQVTQSALIISAYEVYFDTGISTRSITITTTGSWTADKTGTWFSLNKISGSGNDTIIITKTGDGSASPNQTITITNGSVAKVVQVIWEVI